MPAKPRALLGILRDITNYRIAQQRIRLLQTASLAIAEAHDLYAALEQLLREICLMAGWRYAEAWLVEPGTAELSLAAVWHPDDAGLAAIAEHARHFMLSRSDPGAVVRAWTTGQPQWRTDEDRRNAKHKLRFELGASAGLENAYSLPIKHGVEVLAVFNFARTSKPRGDEPILDTIAAVAAQLGTALARKRDAAVAAKNAVLVQEAMEIAQVGTWSADLIVRDPQQSEIDWSPEARRIYGMSESSDNKVSTFLQIIHAEDRVKVQRARRNAIKFKKLYSAEYRIVREDGSVRWVRSRARVERNESGVPIRFTGVSQDITEARLIEEQLRHAQKMEAIGNLTGGLAHDFNNMLGVIVANLDLARVECRRDTYMSELVDEAIEAAMRGAELTRSLLAFARRQALNPKYVSLGEVVPRTVQLLRRTLGEHIEISFHQGQDLWPIMVDPAQLEACLVNLATNARDAMPGAGRLLLASENCQLDADYASRHEEVAPGDYVLIEVSDTGSGMTPEVLSRVFEPFFTTKGAGEGTGLGLSMVFGFVKQSGGHITLYSEPGIGTTFRLYFPRAETGKEEAAFELNETGPVGRGERVLAVEDNVSLRQAVTAQLRDLGYDPLEAAGADAAIEILKREKVDLLFTDVVMPGPMDGVALAQHAIDRRPEMKILLTSGFPGANLTDRLQANGSTIQLLHKPYRRDELARTLRQVLDSACPVPTT